MSSIALDSIARLRRLAATLEDGDADERWLAGRLQRYFDEAPRGLSLDLACGLSPVPGQANWWTEEAIARRDAALRELAARYYPSLRPGTQARKIERLVLRYAASAWRHDRDRADMPERYKGTETEQLWRAFKSGAAMPLKRRQIETVLAVKKKDTAA